MSEKTLLELRRSAIIYLPGQTAIAQLLHCIAMDRAYAGGGTADNGCFQLISLNLTGSGHFQISRAALTVDRYNAFPGKDCGTDIIGFDITDRYGAIARDPAIEFRPLRYRQHSHKRVAIICHIGQIG